MFVAPFALTLALTAAQAPAEQKQVAARLAAAQALQQKLVAQKRAAVRQPPVAIDLPVAGGGSGAPGVSSTLSAGGSADESVIKAAKVGTTDGALLDFF